MNKNAYEIRLELLQMAHNDMNRLSDDSLNLLKVKDERKYEQYRELIATGKGESSPFISSITNKTLRDNLPQTDQIIARAESLYRFVNGRE